MPPGTNNACVHIPERGSEQHDEHARLLGRVLGFEIGTQVPGAQGGYQGVQWLYLLLEAGLLRGMLVPSKPIRALRSLTRYARRRSTTGVVPGRVAVDARAPVAYAAWEPRGTTSTRGTRSRGWTLRAAPLRVRCG